MQELTLRKPDDLHLHLRDGESMASVLPYTALRSGRALIMPNLNPPVTKVTSAMAYRQRIINALPKGSSFDPYMTLYLTDSTSPVEIAGAASNPHILAAKLYPANATTNSALGVTDIDRLAEVFEMMERRGLVLSIHGELLRDIDGEVDVFDRERRFLEDILSWIVESFPELKIVLEHITTADAVDFITDARPGVAATITAHHLLEDRNALFRGGIRPHYYCLPILKRRSDREALLDAATSGNPKFFLGTDSAPHECLSKESSCGCAGCFTACAAIELYAEAFEEIGMLHRLEGFASMFGADFYGLPRNTDTITLEKVSWVIPKEVPFAKGVVIPFRAGKVVHWKLRIS